MWQDAGRIGVKVHDHCLEGLEICNSWSLSASQELLAMPCESRLKHGDDLVPELLEPLRSPRLVKRGSAEHRSVKARMGALHVLHVVHQRVDRPARKRVLRVVTVPHAKHAKDGARLAHFEAVLLPDRHRAEWQKTGGLELAEGLHGLTRVNVVGIGVGQKHSDAGCATINLKVVQFAWHDDFIVVEDVDFGGGGDPIRRVLLMMGALEILLEIGVACQSSFKRLKLRIIVKCLIAEVLAILQMLKHDKIGKARL